MLITINLYKRYSNSFNLISSCLGFFFYFEVPLVQQSINRYFLNPLIFFSLCTPPPKKINARSTKNICYRIAKLYLLTLWLSRNISPKHRLLYIKKISLLKTNFEILWLEKCKLKCHKILCILYLTFNLVCECERKQTSSQLSIAISNIYGIQDIKKISFDL